MEELGKWKNYNKSIKLNKYRCFIKGKKMLIKEEYYKMMKEKLDLNNCNTLSEKLQKLKLSNNELYSIISDKYRVRNYIKNKLGTDKYLIPIYFAKKKITIKDLKDLPKSFILKTNNGSGTNKIVINKKEEDLKQICKFMNYCVKLKYGYIWGEFYYNKIPRKIIAEKLLTKNPEDLYDYKIHCFNGKTRKEKFISVTYLTEEGIRKSTYDEKWNKLDFSFNIKNGNRNIPKPKKLDEMIHIADTLSEKFDFLRVDLYYFNEKKYIGELTLFPGAGYLKFEPDKMNLYYGNLIS